MSYYLKQIAVSFGASFWLWVAPLCLLALALLWVWSAKRTRAALRGAFNTPLLARLVSSVDSRWRWIKRAVVALGIAALILALARPQWGRNEVEVERTGVDLVIALDVSRSMLAADADKTNRLHAARTAIEQLLNSMGGDRVGLVAFAGEAFMIAPLTRDHVAVERALGFAHPSMLSEQGSNLAEAIKKATESFERGAEGSRALLVVSDGEALQGDAVEAARKAYQQGIRIHTAGVGSAIGARVPADGTMAFVRNALGREVISRKDEQKLQQVATAGGGMYTRIEDRNSQALAEWFRRAAAALPRSTEKKVLNEPREQFQWPLAIALGLLALEWVMTDRRKCGPRAQKPVRRSAGVVERRRSAEPPLREAAGVVGQNRSRLEFPSSRFGFVSDFFLVRLVRKTWLLFAMVACTGQVALGASIPWKVYNEGVEAYAKGDYTNALQQWQELSVQKIPRGLQRPVWFQLGNVHFRLGEPLEQAAPEQAIELWTRSCEAYRSALAGRSRDADVLHNLALVERRLARLLHRLGMEEFRLAEAKPSDEAIDLLRHSADHLQQAVILAPAEAPLRSDYEQALRTLRERLKTRAEKSETKGDDLARQNNPWTEQQAEDEYRSALQDLGEARKPQAAAESTTAANAPQTEPLEQSMAQAQERVEQKLSQLLTRRGRREQKQGNELADITPDKALGHYESALEHYRAAQEAQASNQAAQKGEREVREAMERLHVQEGNAELERGKEALAQQSPRAAPALSKAISQFDAALQLNAKNDEAREGLNEARRLLPDALNLAGQTELTSGDRSERRSPSDAMAHYQEAQKDFSESLELKPNQAPAEKGLKEAEEKLARARKRAEEEAEAVAKASQPPNQPPRSLQALLGQVGEKERTPEMQRERKQGARNFGQRKYHDDW